jgi:hypothetical protein
MQNEKNLKKKAKTKTKTKQKQNKTKTKMKNPSKKPFPPKKSNKKLTHR